MLVLKETEGNDWENNIATTKENETNAEKNNAKSARSIGNARTGSMLGSISKTTGSENLKRIERERLSIFGSKVVECQVH